jgi:hypothetical protein
VYKTMGCMAARVVQSISPDDRATNAEAAQILGVNPETLAQWRYLQRFYDQLPYFKVGRKVFYSRSDLYKFLDSCKVGGTALHSE